MLDQWLVSAPDHDADGVKAIVKSAAAVPSPPGAGHPLDLTPLQRRDRFQGVPEPLAGSSFDLHKRDQVAATDDEVDLAVARAIVALQNPVAEPLQVGRRESLAQQPEIARRVHDRAPGRRLPSEKTRSRLLAIAF